MVSDKFLLFELRINCLIKSFQDHQKPNNPLIQPISTIIYSEPDSISLPSHHPSAKKDIGPRISVHLAMAIGDISGHPRKKKRHEMHYSRYFPPFITIFSSFRSLMPYSLYLRFIFSVHCFFIFLQLSFVRFFFFFLLRGDHFILFFGIFW